DGRRALSAGQRHGRTDSGVMRLWDLAGVKEVRCFAMPGQVYAVAFSPDGRRALSGGNDWARLRLWDLETGKELLQLGQDTSALSVAFSPDGRRALSSSRDGTTRLWDLDSGKELRQFRVHKPSQGIWSHAAFSSD